MEFHCSSVVDCTNEDVNDKNSKPCRETEHKKDIDKDDTTYTLINTKILTFSKVPRIGINKSSVL